MKTIDDELPERLQTSLECIRGKYEFTFNNKVYCGTIKECIYKSKKPDKNGCYSCMNRDKRI